mgnify:CR=1 FL=1
MKHVKIPTDWSAEEALSVSSFLETIIRSIWQVHGEKMDGHRQRIRRQQRALDRRDAIRLLPRDSELPF